MTLRQDIGKLGEDAACDFLKEKGFKILFRNARNKFGELDIVARDRDNTLVFVEVKTIRQYGNSETFAEFMPEDQMSQAKMKKFKRAAELLANNSYARIINENAGWRLDFVGVIFDDSGTHTIRHYKNI